LVADHSNIFELTGNGDVLEPEQGVMGVGSGGQYAQGMTKSLKCVISYINFESSCCVSAD
jgi:ATP-dependent HslUV protease subunit HslV